MVLYSIVLKSFNGDQAGISKMLSRIFGLKETTCRSVLESMPIVIIDKLPEDYAAALILLLNPLKLLGVDLFFVTEVDPDLPKIEWPVLPPVLKLPIDKHVQNFEYQHICLSCGSSVSILDSLKSDLLKMVSPAAQNDSYTPQPIEDKFSDSPSAKRESSRVIRFSGSELPEITPFSTPALPAISPAESSKEISSRMDELFPDDTAATPTPDNVTDVLNSLMPDDGLKGNREPSGITGSISKMEPNNSASGNFALFLSKINQEQKRLKAVPLLAELTGESEEIANELSKKVIIPVLRGVTKAEADSAKHRFAEIGVLARIKTN